MAVRVVDERNVLDEAVALVRSAERTLDIASPWIRGSSIRRLLSVRSRDATARVLFRVKEPEDLDITDLGALLTSARRGVGIRYSARLHAKVIVADGLRAIVSSSNVTEAAGFGSYEPERRNREMGVVIEDDPVALDEIMARFEAAWAEGQWLDDAVTGVVMDFPTDRTFHVACLRAPSPGTYIAAPDHDSGLIVGRVASITGYNRTFPRMTAGMWATQGYGVAPDAGGKSYEYADLQSLFSTPDKERGVLGVVAATDGSTLFHVAAVEVLAGVSDGQAHPPRLPAAPGTLARRAGARELDPLLGTGTLALGSVWHHPEVIVRADAGEILTRHLAVVGMTGSGKSNAVLVLVRELLAADAWLRVVLVDTHGEYRNLTGATVLSPRMRADVLADGAVKLLLRLAREDVTLVGKVREAAEGAADLDSFATTLEGLADGERTTWAGHAQRLVAMCRERPHALCLGGPEVSFDAPWAPGVNVVDVSEVEGIEARAGLSARPWMRCTSVGSDGRRVGWSYSTRRRTTCRSRTPGCCRERARRSTRRSASRRRDGSSGLGWCWRASGRRAYTRTCCRSATRTWCSVWPTWRICRP